MNTLLIILTFVAGVLMGGLYFGGLWWTVRTVPIVRRPEILIVASFAVRAALIVAGIYVIAAGRWEGLIACLVGFLVARTVMVANYKPVSSAV